MRLGHFPALALASAAGLALVSVADALSRSGRSHAELLFWLGLLVIFVPTVARLTSAAPGRGERVALLVVLGLSFYLVQVLRDPFAYTSADELVHQHNVLQILNSQALFGSNPILKVTPSYPGLESVTAALASTGGMSTFAAGLIVIGVGRVILMLALFLLYENVTGSSRIAGLAAALYAANPHYLFFTAAFSYESLALPLALLAAFATVRARPPDEALDIRWGIVAVAAILAVVATHHMTSYALVALLVAICLVPLPWRHTPARRPWALAAIALAATGLWLTLVASQTVGYLSPVLTNAIADTFRTAAGESGARALFTSSGGQVAPAWEHFVGIGAIIIIVAALPFGLSVLWNRYRDRPLAVVLGCAGVAYVGTLALRVVPAAWETAARASEFLFIGVAFVLALAALAGIQRLRTVSIRVSMSVSGIGAAVIAGVVLMGGVVAGSSAVDRLAQPYRVSVPGTHLDPPGVAVARWARDELGPGERIAANQADARLLLVDGEQHVFTGSNPDIEAVMQTPKLYSWELDLLRRHNIRYVVVDARTASSDVSNGYYFPRHAVGLQDRFPPAAITKFQRAGAQRIYSDGNISVYDLRGVSNAAASP
jgi:hypothetical protein